MKDLSEVRTSRLVLRRTMAEDWRHHRLLDGDPEAMATLGGLRSTEQTREYTAEQARHWAEHGFGWWTVFDGRSGEFVGRGGLRHVVLDDGLAGVEVGYALVPSRWGEGLATEVASEAIKVGIETLNLDRIIGFALPSNAASRKVLEKVGMSFVKATRYKGFQQVLYEWVRT